MMIDLVIGFMSKASPQLPALLLGIPVKNLTGYALLIGATCRCGRGFWNGASHWPLARPNRMLHLAH